MNYFWPNNRAAATQNAEATQAQAQGTPIMASPQRIPANAVQSQEDLHNRPGKFQSLSELIAFDAAHQNPDPVQYRRYQIEPPRPGHVVHIRDSDENDKSRRLNQRAMIVMRVQTTSMTCIPICRHHDTTSLQDHWPITSSNTAQSRNSTPLTPHVLNITLHAGLHSTLGPDLTTNLSELWNVETGEPSFAILGRVSEDAWDALAAEVVRLFSDSLLHPPRAQGTANGSPAMSTPPTLGTSPLTRSDTRSSRKNAWVRSHK